MIPKHRMWIIRDKKMWHKVDCIDFYSEQVVQLSYGDGDYYSPNPIYCFNEIVLMQYVGAKDKNGKEIYEGDILIDDMDIREGAKHVVEFCYGSFCEDVESRNGCDHFSRIFPDWSNQEVIGNIYENPELLEDKQCSK